MQTRQSYLIDYRVHWTGGGYGEFEATAQSDQELFEFDLQQLVLDHLPGHPDVPDGLRSEDFVITRFRYVVCPPLDVPDVEQSGRTSAPADTDAPDRPGQV
jgi:hypothetical protein